MSANHKLKVFNPESVDKLLQYVEQHFTQLGAIEKAIQDQDTSEAYARRKYGVALDGTGAGTVQFGVPAGYDYRLERVTTVTPGPGTCGIYIDTTQAIDLAEWIANSQNYSDAFNNTIYAPAESYVYAVFAGAGINGQAAINFQIKVIKRPAHTHSPRTTFVGDA